MVSLDMQLSEPSHIRGCAYPTPTYEIVLILLLGLTWQSMCWRSGSKKPAKREQISHTQVTSHVIIMRKIHKMLVHPEEVQFSQDQVPMNFGSDSFGFRHHFPIN